MSYLSVLFCNVFISTTDIIIYIIVIIDDCIEINFLFFQDAKAWSTNRTDTIVR